MYPAPPCLRRGDNLQLTWALLKPQMCPAPPSETICSKISHSVCHLQALKKLTAKTLCKRHVCLHHLCQMYVSHVCSRHLCQMYVSHVCSHHLCQMYVSHVCSHHLCQMYVSHSEQKRCGVSDKLCIKLRSECKAAVRKKNFHRYFFFSLNFPPPISFVSKWLVEFDVDESLLW